MAARPTASALGGFAGGALIVASRPEQLELQHREHAITMTNSASDDRRAVAAVIVLEGLLDRCICTSTMVGSVRPPIENR